MTRIKEVAKDSSGVRRCVVLDNKGRKLYPETGTATWVACSNWIDQSVGVDDPRDLNPDELYVFLQADLLRTLHDMRAIKPDAYLVRLLCQAINGELMPKPIHEQKVLPFTDKGQARTRRP